MKLEVTTAFLRIPFSLPPVSVSAAAATAFEAAFLVAATTDFAVALVCSIADVCFLIRPPSPTFFSGAAGTGLLFVFAIVFRWCKKVGNFLVEVLGVKD